MKRLLLKALTNRFKMDKDDAIKLTRTVEDIFNGRDEVEDMTIDKYARSLLYELHREKLLNLRREEFKENGKFIRKYYWSLNNENIKNAAYEKIKEDNFGIYKKLPEKAWLVHNYN